MWLVKRRFAASSWLIGIIIILGICLPLVSWKMRASHQMVANVNLLAGLSMVHGALPYEYRVFIIFIIFIQLTVWPPFFPNRLCNQRKCI